MTGIILLALIVAGVFWFVGAYNSLVSLRNQVFNAWKQIDVQLKRRHDLIPNLVETVKGVMNFEKGTLESVIAARNQAIASTSRTVTDVPSAQQVQATAAAEGQLSSSLGRLFAVVEAYPDLKSSANVAQLQEELTTTENKIAFARQLYNDQATVYNTRQQQFPGSLVAGFAKATVAPLWEITDAAERDVVKVDLSLNSNK